MTYTWAKDQGKGATVNQQWLKGKYRHTCSLRHTSLLWELLLLFQPTTFKIPVHLGVVSYTINTAVKHALALLLPALTSGCYTVFLFPVVQRTGT